MANLSYSSGIQDRIAYNLFGSAYSSLTTAQKNAIDGGSAADPPTAGHAKDAFLTIKQMSQWWELNDATTVTDAAEAWAVAEITFRTSLNVRPERIEDFRRLREQALNDYLDTVTSTVITTGYESDVYTLTLQSARYYVLRRIANQNRKLMLSLPPGEIDAATRWCLNWVWHRSNWNFRRRNITIDIATSSNGNNPTINTASGETFDQLATQSLYFTDTSAQFARWATAEQMAAFKADTNTPTGRPAWFRIERSGSTRTWHWHPAPDQAYTVRAEILIDVPGTTTPGVPTSATDTVPFAKLPSEFIPAMKELIVGRVMKSRGVGDQVWKEAVDEVERFLPTSDDYGEADVDGPVRDVYQDAYNQRWGITGWFGGYTGGVGGPM